MHALEQRRLAAWKGHSADLKASQQQHTHTHTYAHTAVQCAPVPGAVGARCAVLEFTSDSFCWSLNTSFPFGLCLSPLSLRLLMIGTSMSSVCIFHGRLTSSSADSAYRSGGQLKTAPRQEGGTDSGEPSWGSPPPPSAAVATPPPSRYVWFAVPARTERAELNRVASADTWNQNDVSVLKWRLNGSKYEKHLHLIKITAASPLLSCHTVCRQPWCHCRRSLHVCASSFVISPPVTFPCELLMCGCEGIVLQTETHTAPWLWKNHLRWHDWSEQFRAGLCHMA